MLMLWEVGTNGAFYGEKRRGPGAVIERTTLGGWFLHDGVRERGKVNIFGWGRRKSETTSLAGKGMTRLI